MMAKSDECKRGASKMKENKRMKLKMRELLKNKRERELTEIGNKNNGMSNGKKEKTD